MILADKIIKLRKQLGWSQEELADKMDVSRQSVSKWESTNSIPDLTKIIKLAELFNVTTDFLLKDEVETAEFLGDGESNGAAQISLEQALRYVDTKLEAAGMIVRGVALCVCSAIPLFFLLALVESGQTGLSGNIAAVFGVVGILVMVALGIGSFVKADAYKREWAPISEGHFELAYGVHSVFSDKIDKFTPSYHRKITLGIALFILAAVPLLLTAVLSGSGELIFLMLAVLLLMVAAGLYVIIPAATQNEAYNWILAEGDLNAGKSKATRQAEKLAAFFFPLLVAIFLGWSFWTMAWHITWIVFPVGAVLFVALLGLWGLFEKDEER